MRVLGKLSKRLSAWMVRGIQGAMDSRHRGAVSASYVIGAVVALLMFSIIFPIAMQEVVTANTTGWQASVLTIFGTLVPILAAVGIAIKFISGVGK